MQPICFQSAHVVIAKKMAAFTLLKYKMAAQVLLCHCFKKNPTLVQASHSKKFTSIFSPHFMALGNY